MADKNRSEAILFAKWHSTNDLINNDEFWNDCKQYLRNRIQILPLEDGEITRSYFRTAELMGKPCMIDQLLETIPLLDEEYKLLNENVRQRIKTIKFNGRNEIDLSDGCQFIKDGKCSIADFRPSVCEFFPILPGVPFEEGDGTVIHMRILLAYDETFDDIRNLYKQLIDKNNSFIVLPDMSLAPVYNEELEKQMFSSI